MVIIASVTTSVAHAANILKKDYPERYVVKKGDTLWDISAKYLNEPWRWKEIWKSNQSIKNPDLIFPGDVLILSYVNGKPVLRSLKRETVYLKPSVRVEDITNAIPPVSPRAIAPFFRASLITTKSELESSAYIVDGFNDRLVGGKGVEMYARGLKETTASKYHIIREGNVLVHPQTGEKLGLEALDIGSARLVRPGDPAKVMILTSKEGVEIGDHLKPDNSGGSLPFFFPSVHPDTETKGVILRSDKKTAELGRLDIVSITFGEREGIEPGQVFKVISGVKTKVDPKTKKKFDIPEEQIGLIMIFRVFEKVSYGIITNATRQIVVFDQVVHPKAE
jgi:LysM repeat protein